MKNKIKTLGIATLAIGLGSTAFGYQANAETFFEDLVVSGSACIGKFCPASADEYPTLEDNQDNGNQEPFFQFNTLILKDEQPSIKFTDTSASASFPTTDWKIQTNNNNSNHFSIIDVTSNKTLLKLCPPNSTNCTDIIPFGEGVTSQDIINNSTNTSNNTTAISNNSTAIQSLTSSIDDNSARITKNSKSISINKNQIHKNAKRIDKLQDNINKIGFGVAGATALNSALSALPTGAFRSNFSCGIGSGVYSNRAAMSLGCAANINERVSLNIGGATLFNGSTDYGNGTLDNYSAKAGVLIKLGHIPKIEKSVNEKSLEGKITNIESSNKALEERIRALEMATH